MDEAVKKFINNAKEIEKHVMAQYSGFVNSKFISVKKEETKKMIKEKEELVAPPVFYNVINRDRYAVTLQRCTDILELKDVFLKEEDVKLLIENEGNSYWHNTNSTTPFTITFKSQIKATFAKWPELMREECYSTRRTTHEINDALDVCEKIGGYWTNKLAPEGYYISGRTLFNEEKAKARARNREIVRGQYILQRDVKNLVKACSYVIAARYKIDIDFKVSYIWQAYGYIMVSKKLISWKEVIKMIKKKRWNLQVHSMDYEWIEKLWKEPELAKSFK